MAKMNFSTDDYLPEEGRWMTYDGWRRNGYTVAQGERCRRRSQGSCVYHESQVEPIQDPHADYDFDPYDEIRVMCYELKDRGGHW